MSEWISVKDRLPEKDDHYLIYYSSQTLFTKTYRQQVVYLVVNDIEKWGWPSDRLYKVTHWMPLPEPPEVE